MSRYIINAAIGTGLGVLMTAGCLHLLRLPFAPVSALLGCATGSVLGQIIIWAVRR